LVEFIWGGVNLESFDPKFGSLGAMHGMAVRDGTSSATSAPKQAMRLWDEGLAGPAEK